MQPHLPTEFMWQQDEKLAYCVALQRPKHSRMFPRCFWQIVISTPSDGNNLRRIRLLTLFWRLRRLFCGWNCGWRLTVLLVQSKRGELHRSFYLLGTSGEVIRGLFRLGRKADRVSCDCRVAQSSFLFMDDPVCRYTDTRTNALGCSSF